jgi:small-conductance mechanosensitive channel
MTKARAIIFFVLCVFVSFSQPAWSQDQNAAPPANATVTPDQARQAVDILQDDNKRNQLIQTLRTIAKASPAPAASNTSATPPADFGDNLGVQLLAQVSNWFGDASDELAHAARSVSDFPKTWHWLLQQASDPAARALLLDTAWKLVLVIALAFAVEWVMRFTVRRPLRAVNRYVPTRARRVADRPAAENEVSLVADAHEVRRWHSTLDRTWQLILRFPFALARLCLDLLPVVCFATVGNLLLATDIGGEATPRVVILAIVNAYVICRGILCVTAALISPPSSQPSLFVIRDESAAYLDVWWARIVVVTVFGVAFANIALLLGLYRSAYFATVRLVMLLVHLFVVIVILQCRRSVAGFIRARDPAHGTFVALRNRLADIWYIPAIILDLSLWSVWALRVQNGYVLLLKYSLTTVAVLVIARLVSVALLMTLDRVFRINPEFLRQFPGLEERANRYFPLLRAAISGLVAIVTIIAWLEIWGIDATAWFSSSQVGGRLASAVITIGLAGVVALAVWEASNAAIEQHLLRLSREGRFARVTRLRTFLPMLRTTLLAIIITVVTLTALSELGVNIAPLLAGAGIVGIAIGFGSQKLVQDLVTGLFLLLENAMQVGDTVTVSGLTGVVEALSIRTIRLRAGDGSIHIVPFSSVTSVTNTNRGIGNAAISVDVAYKEDTDRVGEVLKEIATKMRSEPQFKGMIRGDLDLWGVDRVNASMATVVGQIECTDTGRWPVQREFYRRMKKRFQELGIEIARPSQTTVILQNLPTAADAPEIDRSEQPRRKASAGA